jgi:carbon starvation protein
MVFMFTTTFTASWKLIFLFRAKAAQAKAAADAFNFNLDAFLVTLMGLLAVIVLTDVLYKWYAFLSGRRPMTSSEIVEYAADRT